MKKGAVRNPLARLVVIGDDHLHPRGARGRDLLGAGDPAVGRQEQIGAAGGQPLHPGDRQPVAVAQAVGYVPVAACPQLAQRPDQDRGRADTVAVVVTVDGDRAPVGDRPPDPLGHLLHRVELERIVRLAGLEEGARLVDRPVAPAHQRHRHRLGQREPLHQRAHLGVRIWLQPEGSIGGRGIGRATAHSARLRTGGDGTRPRTARTMSRRVPASLTPENCARLRGQVRAPPAALSWIGPGIRGLTRTARRLRTERFAMVDLRSSVERNSTIGIGNGWLAPLLALPRAPSRLPAAT